MPIVDLDGNPTLICVNRHPDVCAMVKFEEGDGREVGLPVIPGQKKLLLCRVFTCPTCGYVELYVPRDP